MKDIQTTLGTVVTASTGTKGKKEKASLNIIWYEDIHDYRSSVRNLRWLNRVMQDHEARASDRNRKLIFSFFLLFS